MRTATFYYFDAVYVSGQWMRCWYATEDEAEAGLAQFREDFASDEEDPERDMCGERGDYTGVSSVEAPLSKAGVLRLLSCDTDPNNC